MAVTLTLFVKRLKTLISARVKQVLKAMENSVKVSIV